MTRSAAAVTLLALAGCGGGATVVSEKNPAVTPIYVVPAQPAPDPPRVDRSRRDAPVPEPAAPVVVRDEPVEAVAVSIEAEPPDDAPTPSVPTERGNSLDAQDENGIRLTAGFPCSPNTLVVTCTGPAHFEVRFPGGGRMNTGWFLFRVFRVEHAPGAAVRIDLAGAPIRKWRTLNPVYCATDDLSDPANYTVEEPETREDPQPARNGPLIPDTSGQRWQFITDVEADEASKTLVLRQQFEDDSVFVAMRPPYTPDYHERYLDSLRENPLARVHTVGYSNWGRPLNVVQIGGLTDEEARDNPCILLYAREHADEHDTSWAVRGAIDYLLSDGRFPRRLRRNVTFLLIPLLDPDGAARSQYENMMRSFHREKSTHENEVWVEFFKDRADKMYRLDLVLNLHNVESSEAGHLSCARFMPEWSEVRHEACEILHRRGIVPAFRSYGFDVAEKPWGEGVSYNRLCGTLFWYYGPIDMAYEVNSQAPDRHLTLAQLGAIGAMLIDEAGHFLVSDHARPALAIVDMTRFKREKQWLFYRPDRRLLSGETIFEAEYEFMHAVPPEAYSKTDRYQDYMKRIEGRRDLR